jgi:hypothetical protein
MVENTLGLKPLRVLFCCMGFEGEERSRRSPDAISPEGTGPSVARHGSAGKDFTQVESRRDDPMGSSHANSKAPEIHLSSPIPNFSAACSAVPRMP